MKFSGISSRLREYPVAAVAILLIVVFAVLLVLRAGRATELDEALADAQRTWTRMEANLREAANLQEDVERLGTIKAAAERRLMTREEVALNLDYFYRLEAAQGVRIEAIQQVGGVAGAAAAVPETALFDRIGFNLTVRGRFGEIVRFIRLLESDHYFVRVETVNLSVPAGATGETLTAQLAINVLGRKP